MAKSEANGFLHLWDAWDRFPGGRPFPRKEKATALGMLSKNRGLLLRGSRGVGKTTLLKMLTMDLNSKGMDRKSIVFIDLEDPLWAPRAKIEKIFPALGSGTRLLVLDGVERLHGWEKLARQGLGKGITILASMTGHEEMDIKGLFTMDLLPLGLAPWVQLYTDKKVDSGAGEGAFTRYLMAGGLPVARQAGGRRQALQELFYSSLMKDVLLLRRVRAPEVLTAMAVYLMGMTGRPVSAARMRGLISKSMDQTRMLLDHLERSGLISLVSRLEDADRDANQASRLVFACDTGLATAISPVQAKRGLEDLVYLALTVSYHNCLRQGYKVWAWRQQDRLGLALGDGGGRLELMLDVQMKKGQADSNVLQSAMKKYGCKDGLLLTAGDDEDRAGIRVVPIWKWLIEESTDISENKISTVKPVKKIIPTSRQLPRHLL